MAESTHSLKAESITTIGAKVVKLEPVSNVGRSLEKVERKTS